MGDHSRPLNTCEATVRIPLIFRQPGRIPAGRTSDLMVANYDFLPSVLDYLGLQERLPASLRIAGEELRPGAARRGHLVDKCRLPRV